MYIYQVRRDRKSRKDYANLNTKCFAGHPVQEMRMKVAVFCVLKTWKQDTKLNLYFFTINLLNRILWSIYQL